ncbi:aromatase/cyclase [Phytoactinopolyspora mesophila]|uniref:Cyclase n=1 Tax=Phytoactinopolyspora mesophila TaxID=2650750 RepID=A0A7K3M0P4_9ACTN|nr:aromatase/cyclase [Phytoactinopolyspora mesophila]NDL56875.1 cyclase [Phytoactinopolyspora mesophila]
MNSPDRREVEHEITVAAPAAAVYGVIADVRHWPEMFPPTVHAEYVERNGREERIRIWATANGEAKSWTSRRMLDGEQFRIDFRQEVSTAPVAEMGGTWLVEPLSPRESRVRLLHYFRAVDDDPASLSWIDRAVDTNSHAELAALKNSVELAADDQGGCKLSFEDTIRAEATAKDMYDFINEAQLWDERLPHVSWVSLSESAPGLQTLTMDTRTKDGDTHRTESVRVCLPNHTIVYKQITLPALLALHTGSWRFVETESGVIATSRHTVVIDPEKVTDVLGADADVAKAREFIRNALGANSRATLGHAREYAESRR